MQKIVLARTGQSDLTFYGKMLAKLRETPSVWSMYQQFCISVYRTSIGKYILFVKKYAEENTSYSNAVAFSTIDDLLYFLEVENGMSQAFIARLRKMVRATNSAFDRLQAQSLAAV